MGGGGDHAMMKELAALGVHFYAPPMLIHRAKDLNLTPDQVTKLRAEMLTMQGRAIDLHAKIEHTKVESARLLAADKPDEKLIGAQIDEAAKAQAELHKLHVGAMVRVRALLTPEQRQKLDEKKPHERPGAGHGPGPVGQADDADDDDDA
jgi:Spy/CpxP family protein refolding chaperone